MNLLRVASAGCLFFSSSSALANGEGAEDPRIYKGVPVPTCGFPTTVRTPSGCTGTLIHPQLVIYAAHCGGGPTTIRFGENVNNPGQSVSANCTTNPAYAGVGDQGNDWAFCVLSQPVTQIPVTPPLVGCDLAEVELGDTVTIVGFGDLTDGSGYGTKRWAQTVLGILDLDANTASVGSNDLPSVCPGDSGGPLFVQVEDGTWRTMGIASTVSGGCGGIGTHSLVPGALEWVESTSGIDVMPCTDAAGNWEPTEDCGGFFAGSEEGVGNWANWCAGTPAGGLSNTCGPPHGAPPDDTAPNVEIVIPDSDEVFEMEPGIIDPFVVEADDGDGWGVVSVELLINGDSFGLVLDSAPFEYTGLQFPKGTHTVVAVAEDWAGNLGESSPRVIYVETEPDPGDTDGDGSGDGGTEGDAEGDGETGGTSGGAGDGDPEGCGCSTPGGAAGSALALFALAGMGRRRPRAHQ